MFLAAPPNRQNNLSDRLGLYLAILKPFYAALLDDCISTRRIVRVLLKLSGSKTVITPVVVGVPIAPVPNTLLIFSTTITRTLPTAPVALTLPRTSSGFSLTVFTNPVADTPVKVKLEVATRVKVPIEPVALTLAKLSDRFSRRVFTKPVANTPDIGCKILILTDPIYPVIAGEVTGILLILLISRPAPFNVNEAATPAKRSTTLTVTPFTKPVAAAD